MIRLSHLVFVLLLLAALVQPIPQPHPEGGLVVSGETCSNDELRAAIEKSLREDIAQTLRALKEELIKNNPAHFVIFCGPSTHIYKYIAQSCQFCTHGSDTITCHVFESYKK